jgi:hypothetical protein
MVKLAVKTGFIELCEKPIYAHSVVTSDTPGFKGGLVSHVAPNTLDREFSIDMPNKTWVTDFT